MTIRQRALWAVGLMLVIFVGVTAGGVFYTRGVDERGRQRIEDVQHQQDRDMCHLLDALLPSANPSPGGYGERLQEGVAHYRASRC